MGDGIGTRTERHHTTHIIEWMPQQDASVMLQQPYHPLIGQSKPNKYQGSGNCRGGFQIAFGHFFMVCWRLLLLLQQS